MKVIDFIGDENEIKHRYWYMSGFLVKYLSIAQANLFLADSLKELIKRIDNLSNEISITYFPLNGDEKDLCDTLDFQEVIPKTVNTLALYVYEENDLRDLIDKIDQLSNEDSGLHS